MELEIPVDAAVNKTEVAEYEERKLKRIRLNEESSGEVKKEEEEPEIVPVVPFEACLERFSNAAMVEDYYSTALGRLGVATKMVRFNTFPRYLVIQLKRYYVDSTWQPKKLEACVEMPENLDLTALR